MSSEETKPSGEETNKTETEETKASGEETETSSEQGFRPIIVTPVNREIDFDVNIDHVQDFTKEELQEPFTDDSLEGLFKDLIHWRTAYCKF